MIPQQATHYQGRKLPYYLVKFFDTEETTYFLGDTGPQFDFNTIHYFLNLNVIDSTNKNRDNKHITDAMVSSGFHK